MTLKRAMSAPDPLGGLATPIFVFFYILIFAQESWKKSLLLAAGTWAFIYLIFCVMMEIQFPWSYIFYSS